MKTNSNMKSVQHFFKNKLQNPRFVFGGEGVDDGEGGGVIIDRPKTKIPPAGDGVGE